MKWFSFPTYVALTTIRFYQKTLSFDHGIFRHLFPNGYCRFYPTCSDYGYIAIERHGLIKGSLLILRRILRCNPFSRGGHDPVPK